MKSQNSVNNNNANKFGNITDMFSNITFLSHFYHFTINHLSLFQAQIYYVTLSKLFHVAVFLILYGVRAVTIDFMPP